MGEDHWQMGISFALLRDCQQWNIIVVLGRCLVDAKAALRNPKAG